MKTPNLKTKQNNKQTEQTNCLQNKTYSLKNSSLMFLLALFVPYIIYFFFVMIVNIFFAGTPFAIEVLTGTTSHYISSFICQASLIGAVLFITKQRKVNFFKANNVNFKLDYVKIIITIAIGLIALFGFNWLSDLIAYGLSFTSYGVSNSSFAIYGVTNFGILLVCILFMAVLPAICEEFAIRGVVLNGFSKKGKNFAILVSALIFMIMHLSLEQSIYQFILGIVLASIVYYSGNILYSIILHFTNNALVLILNYASPHSITPTTFFTFGDFFLPIFTAFISGVVIFFLVKLFKWRCEKTGCKNLCDKHKELETQNSLSNENNTQANLISENNTVSNETQNNSKDIARDLPKPKFDYFDEKTLLIFSLSIGIFTWVITIISKFLG